MQLKYLSESSKRQGRKDWFHTAIGVLFTIIIGLSLAPDQARELLRFATSVLKQIISGALKALN